jgi:hypothetical protein
MAKNRNHQQSNVTNTEVKPIEEVKQESTSLESFLGVQSEEVKVNEFAVAGKLQVLGLRELLMAETFGSLLTNLAPMLDPGQFKVHQPHIKRYLEVALEVSMMVGEVYDDKLGV